MTRFAWAMARRRFGSLVAVGLAVLFGALAVGATVGLAETGVRGHAPTGRLGGADLLVAAPQAVEQEEDVDTPLPDRATVPADVVGRLAALPGVAHAVGDLTFPAVPASTPGAREGHGWSSAALPDAPRLTGRPPARSGEVAVDAGSADRLGLRPGGTVDLVVGGARATYQITAVLDGTPPGFYFTDPEAAVLAGRDHRVDLVALWTRPGTDAARQVRDALAGTGLRVVGGDERGDVETLAAGTGRGTLIALSASIAGVVLLIVGFIVTGALGVHVAGQSRDLALIRAVGATPRQVRRLAATQATLAALAVLPFGIAGGYLLAGRALAWFVDLGIVPPDVPLVRSPVPALVTSVVFLGVVGVAARAAALRVSSLPATEAVAKTGTEPRPRSEARAITGLVLIALATGMAAVPLVTRSMAAVAGTGTAGIVAAIGLALAGPSLVRRAGGLLARLLSRRVSVPGWLATHNLRVYAARGAGALTSLAMAVIFAVTYTFAQTTPQRGAELDVAASFTGTVTVTAPDLGGVPGQALDRLRALPGARAAVRDTSTVLWPGTENGKARAESHPAAVLGADAQGIVDLDITAGSLAALTGDSVAVGASFALFEGLRPGDRHEVILADGTRKVVTVAAVYARELGYGDIVLSPDLPYSPRRYYSSVLVGGADAAAVRAALAGLPGIVVADGPPVRAAGLTPAMSLNLVVIGGLLCYVLLGVVNSLVAATARRRDEFGALRFAGATPRQVRAMVRREALGYGLGACVAGLLLSALPLVFLGVGLLGTPVAAGPWWLVPVVCGVVLVTAYVPVTVAARRAMRV
ncbi:ABC transporter permease [Longispora sp. K20-0274]|uniref:FtsX-like permease family protein n=1 Tax=Longispora sp. K20-0274 TaxID=3088255 RepID=UPI00399BE6FE